MADDKTKLVDEKSEAPSFGTIEKEDPEKDEKKNDPDANSETSTDSEKFICKSLIRWYILTLFCLWALTNLAFWNTWGPIAQSAMLVFGWSNLDVVMPVIVGTLASVLSQIFYAWLLDGFGLRLSSLSSGALMLIGAGLRCITPSTPAATWLMNIAAVLNGLGAPIFIGGAPVISSIWFPASERVTATSSGIAFCYGGIAFAFLLGPFVVNYIPESYPGAVLAQAQTTASPLATPSVVIQPNIESANFSSEFIVEQRNNIMKLMYIEFGWIALLFLITLAYYPDKPEKPPSLSATYARTNVWDGLCQLLKTAQFWWILIPFSLTQGVFFGWGSALEINLHPIGVTQDNAGWVGFAASIAGIAGTLAVGRIGDVFSRHLKHLVIIFLAIAVIFCAWMTAVIVGALTMNLASLLISTVVSATATQATCPLFYEMACESSYPVSESVIAATLTMAGNILNFMFLLVFLIPDVGTRWLNYTLLGALMGSILFTCFYTQTFRRLAIDNGHTAEGYNTLDEEKKGEGQTEKKES